MENAKWLYHYFRGWLPRRDIIIITTIIDGCGRGCYHPHIRIDPYDRVRLRIDADKPYIQHKEHQKKYVPAPDYRYDKNRSLKEREANREWYKEYNSGKGNKKEKGKKKEDIKK